jgi:hypothetical protein
MNFNKRKEKYKDDNDNSSMSKTIISIFWGLITIAAIYYSFTIEKGFKFGPFLLALFFSPIYLVWGIYKAGIPPSVKINK